MKIDFVVPWVDGNDPDWLREKKLYVDTQADDARRFRDWDLMPYWFRSIEKFAPWVNKIYFITWGHVPEFLNLDHPKLEVVNHKDFIPEEYLPTYNANTIELNLHRISSLSEHFVYFNDDIFLIKPTTKEDFFENGLPKDSAILRPIVPSYYNSISNIMLNNNAIINSHFDYRKSMRESKDKWFTLRYSYLILLNFLFLPWPKSVGIYQEHLPSSFLKSTFNEVWHLEYDILDQTSKYKLRNNFKDVNQWLLKEWQIMEGKFEPRKISFGEYIMVEDEQDIDKIAKAKRNKKTKVICINDHIETNFEDLTKKVESELEEILSEKSSFEV